MACAVATSVRRADDYEDDASCVGRTTSASPASGSVTDVSEDSVEVKIQPVAAMPLGPSLSTARRNKRKSTEPRKLKDTTNVPVGTSVTSAAVTTTGKQPRFWSDKTTTLATTTNDQAGSDVILSRDVTASNRRLQQGRGHLPEMDTKVIVGDGHHSSQFTRPHKTLVSNSYADTPKSRSSKSSSVRQCVDQTSGAPLPHTGSGGGASTGRTNRRVAAAKDRSSGSGKMVVPDQRVRSSNSSSAKAGRTPTGSRHPLPPPKDVVTSSGVAVTIGRNVTCDNSSNDASVTTAATDVAGRSPFLLNLPFDVRNILGPSAATLLQSSAAFGAAASSFAGASGRCSTDADSGLDQSGEADSPFRHFRNLLLSDRMLQAMSSADAADDDDSEEEDSGHHQNGGDHPEDRDDKEVRELVHPFSSAAKRKRCHQPPEVSATTSTPLVDGGGDYEEGTSRPSSSLDYSNGPTSGGGGSYNKQRNYKNMTRERRVEANARERTRVHTISSAFEELRRAVPSYSCHQKLSKLAILRIACSYILALASLNDLNYSGQPVGPTFAECVDQCTQTIQAEGKARKRKD